jgi:hypothetical protein
MTDVQGIALSYYGGQIDDFDMIEICEDLPEVAEALRQSSPNTGLAVLVAHLMAATGPNRSLDYAVAEALGWREKPCTRGVWLDPEGKPTTLGVRHYTDSIESALSARPDRWCWQIRADVEYTAVVWKFGDAEGCWSGAATAALAVLIAALKARAHHFSGVRNMVSP